MKTIYLAGGCFWGMQKYFDQFEGVIRTIAGYANGPDSQPTYEEVCDNSGHAETVRIDFDENAVSLTRLLQYYFLVINPTSINRQGNDIGIQYRTGIYYTEEDQLAEINAEYKRQETSRQKSITRSTSIRIRVGIAISLPDILRFRGKGIMRRRQKNRKLDILKQSRGQRPMPRPAVFRNRKKYDRNIWKDSSRKAQDTE